MIYLAFYKIISVRNFISYQELKFTLFNRSDE